MKMKYCDDCPFAVDYGQGGDEEIGCGIDGDYGVGSRMFCPVNARAVTRQMIEEMVEEFGNAEYYSEFIRKHPEVLDDDA